MRVGDPLTFGRDIIPQWCLAYIRAARTSPIRLLDLGCGTGEDLQNIRAVAHAYPLELSGVEFFDASASKSRDAGIEVFSLDIEKQLLPGNDGEYDIVIANQVLEHTKDIFWIVSEIARVLRPNGVFIVGVPNLASLHNRLLLLFGEQPTAIDVLGPHVRGFTAGGLTRLVEANGFFHVERTAGGNFYPFPPPISKWLSRLLPRMSVGLFVLARRSQREGRFIDVLDLKQYESVFFRGSAPPRVA